MAESRVGGGKAGWELQEHTEGRRFLLPSAHPAVGAQHGTPGAMWRASGWVRAGVAQEQPCREGMLLGRGQVREKREQMMGGSSPNSSGRCWEEGPVSLKKSRFQLWESRPQTSLLSEGPISKVPPSQCQAGAATNRKP